MLVIPAHRFSLFALARSMRWKAGAALLKGSIVSVFGLVVLGEAVYHLFWGGAPDTLLLRAPQPVPPSSITS